MKKINCNIIRDILPLYLDDVVSDETKQMVKEHLQSCASCRAEASSMKKDVILPASKAQRLAEAKVIKGIRNKIFRKKVVVSAATAAAVLAVSAGVYALLTLPRSVIPYEKSGGVCEQSQSGRVRGGVSLLQYGYIRSCRKRMS